MGNLRKIFIHHPGNDMSDEFIASLIGILFGVVGIMGDKIVTLFERTSYSLIIGLFVGLNIFWNTLRENSSFEDSICVGLFYAIRITLICLFILIFAGLIK